MENPIFNAVNLERPVDNDFAMTPGIINQDPIQTTSSPRADANRRNAQLSTGPRTEDGKARSSQNAVRTGWFSRQLRLAEGQEQIYLDFENAWLDELQPSGLLELEFFHDFARASWHKREIIAAQNEATASSAAAFLDESLAKALDRLHRYERNFERRAAVALRELRRLQTERARSIAPPKERSQRSSGHRATPPPGLPDSVLRTLYTMEIETSHWNALLRAHKAGLLLDPDAAAAAAA